MAIRIKPSRDAAFFFHDFDTPRSVDFRQRWRIGDSSFFYIILYVEDSEIDAGIMDYYHDGMQIVSFGKV